MTLNKSVLAWPQKRGSLLCHKTQTLQREISGNGPIPDSLDQYPCQEPTLKMDYTCHRAVREGPLKGFTLAALSAF